MSSDESESLEDQECILKCEGSKQFYNIPAKKVMRSVWFYKLGLEDDDFYPQTFVCDRHFSKKMFDSNGKLKSIAVPDINLSTELNLIKSPKNVIKTTSPVQPKPPKQITKVVKIPIQKMEVPNLKPETSSSLPNPNQTPNLTTNTNIQSTANPLSTESWINDSSNILVDYQLKVRGNHLCDVIEIPQYIVVFTVVKAKQVSPIKLSDIQKNTNVVTKKRVPLKAIPKPTAFITIDDDVDETPEILPESISTVTVQTTPLEIVRLDDQIVHQTEPVEIAAPPELPVDIPQEPLPIVKPIKPPSEPDIVYYTTDETVPPRRDRSVQVDLSNKRLETGTQCDVQLDNDIKKMSYNIDLFWLQSCFKNINTQSKMEECLICGEILNNYSTKLKHAHGHEASPSLCFQCGVMFDSQMNLKIHETTFHLDGLNPLKPHRCPRTNCKKAFRSKKILNKHIEEQHIGIKQHQCIKCLQFFSSPMKLICHQRALDKCLRTRGWVSKRWSRRK